MDGFEARVSGSRVRAIGLGSGSFPGCKGHGLGFRVRHERLGYKVQSIAFGVEGQGLGYRV